MRDAIYFHCLAFSHGRPKTIRIRYVWKRNFGKSDVGKKSTFSKISEYVWTGPLTPQLLTARGKITSGHRTRHFRRP